MDVIITAVGEFIWTVSCALVNFCVSSGVSVIAIFVSFLCAILASAFYKYTTNREQMSGEDATCILVDQDNDGVETPITIISTTDPSVTSSLLLATTNDESNNVNSIESLTEIEICIEEDTTENEANNEETFNENENENEVNNEEASNEIEINNEETSNECEATDEETSDDMLIETVEGSEEEIQKQQIANIYRLLNNQNLINNWTTNDFLDQLKMYGLQAYDDNDLESA